MSFDYRAQGKRDFTAGREPRKLFNVLDVAFSEEEKRKFQRQYDDGYRQEAALARASEEKQAERSAKPDFGGTTGAALGDAFGKLIGLPILLLLLAMMFIPGVKNWVDDQTRALTNLPPRNAKATQQTAAAHSRSDVRESDKQLLSSGLKEEQAVAETVAPNAPDDTLTDQVRGAAGTGATVPGVGPSTSVRIRKGEPAPVVLLSGEAAAKAVAVLSIYFIQAGKVITARGYDSDVTDLARDTIVLHTSISVALVRLQGTAYTENLTGALDQRRAGLIQALLESQTDVELQRRFIDQQIAAEREFLTTLKGIAGDSTNNAALRAFAAKTVGPVQAHVARLTMSGLY